MTWPVRQPLRPCSGRGVRRGQNDRPRPGQTLIRCFALSALLLLLLPLVHRVACASDPPLPLGPRKTATESAEKGAIGVTEHLGSRIPLDLAFRDENGREVLLGELITSPTIIMPVYYGCTNVCNFLQGDLALVLAAIKLKPVSEYKVISLSFDDTETPEMAARAKRMYLTAMDRPFPEEGWRFLTGNTASIRGFTESAGFGFARKGRDFIHPVATLVVGPDGTIVRYLYGTHFLAKDLNLALLEARAGRVGATIRTVVSYCFSFDPAAKTYVFNLLRVSATVVILCTAAFLLFLLMTGKKEKAPHTKES